METARSYFLALAFTLVSFFCLPAGLFAQCTGGVNAGPLSPAPAAAFQTMTVTDGNYYTFTVAPVVGCAFPSYVFSFCAAQGGSASYDTQISILDNAGSLIASNDDACGLQSSLTWTPPAAGTYRILINRFSCTTGGGPATLAYNVSTPPPPTNPNFSLVGNAVAGSTPDCVVLTSNANSQLGCAWFQANSLDFASPFSVDYTVNLGSNDGGADGMTFVLHNDPLGQCACGVLGGALGAAGITNSLIIEIDTYLNSEDRDDGMPNVSCFGGSEPDHLDIWLNGDLNLPGGACPSSPGPRVVPAAIELMDGALAYNIENGLDHVFRVQWTPGAPGTLTATVLNASATTAYGSISHSFDPMTVFGTNTPIAGFAAATGGLSNQHSFCAPITVLPMEPMDFSAMKDGAGVFLEWEIQEEGENEKYTVERAGKMDGTVEWTLIDQILARSENGNANPAQKYSAWDRAPLSGDNFYRLRILDANGDVSYSNIAQVHMDGLLQVSIFPNPASKRFTLHVPELQSPFHLRIVDANGRTVLEKDLAGVENVIETDRLPQGIYFVELRAAVGTFSQKLHLR